MTRWILAEAGADYEDIRFPYGQPIPADVKSRCRWGQVPLVELENGKTLTQSISVARYFASKYNLVPTDPYQASLCDEYVDAIADMMVSIRPVAFLPDSEDKKEKVKEAMKTVKAKFFDVYESIIKKNGHNHLVGDKLSWADIVLAQCLDTFQMMLGVNVAEGGENVNKLKEEVMNRPKIKEWIEKRPKTPF